VFKREHGRCAGQVFIAMSSREYKLLDSVRKAFREAIGEFNESHPHSQLARMRIDEQGVQVTRLRKNRIVIGDLTDERLNVYCEAGLAKARGIPFLLTFHI
jgi:type IV secretory pathway ATPase VirB11/archaellum biosynthesis ATPase